MGLGLHFVDGEGPKFSRPLRDEADVARLAAPDPTVELRYVLDAVRTIRGALGDRVPLIGFSGSPWTLACYMVEGGGSSDFRRVKTMLYRRPDLMHRILEVNARAVTAYLNAQIEAGAQAVMLFDTWGGNLPDGHFQAFSLAYMKRIIAGLATQRRERQPDGTTADVTVPSIVFTKGGGAWLELLAGIGAAAVGVDWTVNLGQARQRIGDALRHPGQHGSDGADGRPRPGAGGSAAHAAELRGAVRRQRPYLQSRPRHQPVHATGQCPRPGRKRPSIQP